jgi:hypothetical protein
MSSNSPIVELVLDGNNREGEKKETMNLRGFVHAAQQRHATHGSEAPI